MSFVTVSSQPRTGISGLAKAALIMGALLIAGVLGYQFLMPNGTMLILRGIAADNAPNGQLDDDAAKQYAWRTGYAGKVLDIAGGTAEQVKMTLDHVRSDPRVRALYGFSGGGYALVQIWNSLTPDERARIEKIVVVGSPGIVEQSFPGASKVVVQEDPPEGHMEGPRVLLRATQ